MSLSASASEGDSGAVQQMDVMIEDVHSRCAMMDEITTQLRDRCEGLIATATNEAARIVSQAKADSDATRDERAAWEEEKARIATTHTFDSIIKLNVGGHVLATTLATLTRYPDTMLGAMSSGRHALVKDDNGAYFIDRDGTHFREIVNFLRAPEVYSTDAMVDRVKLELKIEADFYGLKDLMFPAPPTPLFVKAAPVTMTRPNGVKATVTQDDAGLWYMEGISPFFYARCPVTVCTICGWGQPSCSGTYGWGVARFTTGRTITDAQPRKTGTCDWNGKYCTSC